MDAGPSPSKAHSRSRSATILRNIISSSKVSSPKKQAASRSRATSKEQPSSTDTRALGEIGGNSPSKSPKKSRAAKSKRPDIEPWTEPDTPLSPAESLLLSPQHSFAPKDKENTTPPRSRNEEPYTPIWAEFTSQPLKHLASLEGLSSNNSRSSHQSQGQYSSQPPTKQSQVHCNGASAGTTAPPSVSGEVSRPTSRESPRKSSRIMQAVAKFDGGVSTSSEKPGDSGLQGNELQNAFESVLAATNVPERRRAHMRSLDDGIKRDFIKNAEKIRSASGKTDSDAGSRVSQAASKSRSIRGRGERTKNEDYAQEGIQQVEAEDVPGSPSKRSARSRSRTFTFSKGDRSKKSRSQSRPRSLMALKNLSSSSVNSIGMDGSGESKESHRRAAPDEYANNIKSSESPEEVEVGRIQKLRRLLRHESVCWVDDFIAEGGMNALVGLLRKIMKVEWREEHEDMLLHETLLCLKGLCTTQRALARLNELQQPLFPELLGMIFDEERRGPAEYGTRNIITFLLYTHLSSSTTTGLLDRARSILRYLAGPAPTEGERPADFISKMSRPRPYQRWCKEVTNVTKEVFWIFLHHLNTIPVSPSDGHSLDEPYVVKHFPKERAPVPAAPYVGGVEWEATNYLASHLDLMNGLIASLPTRSERNELREDLRSSGFERVMGGTLRLCKEKFYGAVHDGLRTWVDAAADDGWQTIDVRQGPPKSPTKSTPGSPHKRDIPPQLDLPLAFGDKPRPTETRTNLDDGWQL